MKKTYKKLLTLTYLVKSDRFNYIAEDLQNGTELAKSGKIGHQAAICSNLAKSVRFS